MLVVLDQTSELVAVVDDGSDKCATRRSSCGSNIMFGTGPFSNCSRLLLSIANDWLAKVAPFGVYVTV